MNATNLSKKCGAYAHCQKALVSSKTILALYQGGDIEIKEKRG
jgi:hypothetical protein